MSGFIASCQQSIRHNVSDAHSLSLKKAVAAEFVGTLILVFTGVAGCLDEWQRQDEFKSGNDRTVAISLTFGFAVATAVWCTAHVSGGHVNPAVTVGMLVTRKITLVRAVLYVIAQCAGAIAGAALISGLHVEDQQQTLGIPNVAYGVKLANAFGMELMITFILVFTVFASCDKGRTDLGGSIPLTIGLSVALCHFFAIKYTGSSMNPARSFGPVVVRSVWTENSWENHWVYWAGPISGGILAALLYEFVFATDSSVTKVKHWLVPPVTSGYVPAAVEEKPAHLEVIPPVTSSKV